MPGAARGAATRAKRKGDSQSSPHRTAHDAKLTRRSQVNPRLDLLSFILNDRFVVQ